MELLLRVNMTKQHDVTTRRYYNELFDRFTWKKPQLRVKTTKQHDVTTRRYYNDLFDRFVLHP